MSDTPIRQHQTPWQSVYCVVLCCDASNEMGAKNNQAITSLDALAPDYYVSSQRSMEYGEMTKTANGARYCSTFVAFLPATTHTHTHTSMAPRKHHRSSALESDEEQDDFIPIPSSPRGGDDDGDDENAPADDAKPKASSKKERVVKKTKLFVKNLPEHATTQICCHWPSRYTTIHTKYLSNRQGAWCITSI
jgi:hypothetical protein